mmetsp:Transcript_25847/g.64167  ORF Transcript_25847/g.64167 Transcript_25847/m.64167 type:complete len:206 (+) Transcript_25847:1329-1946(+)
MPLVVMPSVANPAVVEGAEAAMQVELLKVLQVLHAGRIREPGKGPVDIARIVVAHRAVQQQPHKLQTRTAPDRLAKQTQTLTQQLRLRSICREGLHAEPPQLPRRPHLAEQSGQRTAQVPHERDGAQLDKQPHRAVLEQVTRAPLPGTALRRVQQPSVVQRCESPQHLCGALGVTHIDQVVLRSLVENVLDGRRHVELGHVLPCE